MLIRLLIIATLNCAFFLFPSSVHLLGVSLQSQSVTLEGKITSNGNAVVGAIVTASNQQSAFRQTTTSNEEGFYRFEGLPPGSYVITVEQTGFMQMRRQIDLAVGQTTGLNFKVELGGGSFITGRLEGKVTNITKKGVAEVHIKIMEEGTSLTQEVTTDAEGHYQIMNLSPGRYRITVEASGYKTASNKLVTIKEGKLKMQDFRLKISN